MVTRKATTKTAVLKWNPKWLVDPVPPFKNLDRALQRELAQAKKDFAAKVNEILAKGQR